MNRSALALYAATYPYTNVKARLRKYAIAIRITEKKAYFGKAPGES